jgi:hypothetical protein
MVSVTSQIQTSTAIQTTEKFCIMWKNCHNFNITLLKTMLLNHVHNQWQLEFEFISLLYTTQATLHLVEGF